MSRRRSAWARERRRQRVLDCQCGRPADHVIEVPGGTFADVQVVTEVFVCRWCWPALAHDLKDRGALLTEVSVPRVLLTEPHSG